MNWIPPNIPKLCGKLFSEITPRITEDDLKAVRKSFDAAFIRYADDGFGLNKVRRHLCPGCKHAILMPQDVRWKLLKPKFKAALDRDDSDCVIRLGRLLARKQAQYEPPLNRIHAFILANWMPEPETAKKGMYPAGLCYCSSGLIQKLMNVNPVQSKEVGIDDVKRAIRRMGLIRMPGRHFTSFEKAGELYILA
ncbi:MAG TPA: hypothetical protein P5555_05505 [Candidatus Paceibacterota bacterium]|nr:hypothetical protein [Verrucomicrobiota bacterium]HRZ44626.1 hypothetical protein [Candidatus Paceibacterota bacterium]HRZ99790.1 hypothetical protein [Candidatus Paceibacterota bacterium]